MDCQTDVEDMIHCMCHPRWNVLIFSFQIHKLSLFCTFQTQEDDTLVYWFAPSKQTIQYQIEKPATKQDVQTI